MNVKFAANLSKLDVIDPSVDTQSFQPSWHCFVMFDQRLLTDDSSTLGALCLTACRLLHKIWMLVSFSDTRKRYWHDRLRDRNSIALFLRTGPLWFGNEIRLKLSNWVWIVNTHYGICIDRFVCQKLSNIKQNPHHKVHGHYLTWWRRSHFTSLLNELLGTR